MDRDPSVIAPEVFPEAPDRIALFPAGGQQRIIAALRQDVAAGRHLLCITGPAGSGKTVLLRDLQRGLGRSLNGMIEQPVPGRLLFDVAKSLALGGTEDNESSLRRTLVMQLSLAGQQHKPIVLIVDAADRLTRDDFDFLLHFFPSGHSTLILAGRDTPGTGLPGFPALAGAVPIDQCYHVEPLSADETAGYIRHRLRVAALPEDLFEPAILTLIHRKSGGVPGLINRFCADALAGPGTRTVASIIPPMPEPVQAEIQNGLLPQATTDETSTTEDTTAPASERQHDAGPPAQPVVTPQEIRREAQSQPRQIPRLQRSVRIWRAVAILAGAALTVEMTRDVWLDRVPASFASLWSTSAPSLEPAGPERAMPDPVRASAADSPEETAEPPGNAAGHADFAAMNALAFPPEDAAFPLLPNTPIEPETPVSRSTTSASTAPEPAPTPGADPAGEPQQQNAKADRNGAGKAGAGPSPANVSSRMTRAQRREIARLYAERAEYEWRKGEVGAASLSIQHGLSTDPRNPRLLELRAKVLEAMRQP